MESHFANKRKKGAQKVVIEAPQSNSFLFLYLLALHTSRMWPSNPLRQTSTWNLFQSPKWPYAKRFHVEKLFNAQQSITCKQQICQISHGPQCRWAYLWFIFFVNFIRFQHFFFLIILFNRKSRIANVGIGRMEHVHLQLVCQKKNGIHNANWRFETVEKNTHLLPCDCFSVIHCVEWRTMQNFSSKMK